MKQSESKATESKASLKGGGFAKKANPSLKGDGIAKKANPSLKGDGIAKKANPSASTAGKIVRTTTTTTVTKEWVIPSFTRTSRDTTEYFTWLPDSDWGALSEEEEDCFEDYWQGTPNETPRSDYN